LRCRQSAAASTTALAPATTHSDNCSTNDQRTPPAASITGTMPTFPIVTASPTMARNPATPMASRFTSQSQGAANNSSAIPPPVNANVDSSFDGSSPPTCNWVAYATAFHSNPRP